MHLIHFGQKKIKQKMWDFVRNNRMIYNNYLQVQKNLINLILLLFHRYILKNYKIFLCKIFICNLNNYKKLIIQSPENYWKIVMMIINKLLKLLLLSNLIERYKIF